MEITINPKIYPVEAVLNACYAFLDTLYVFLDTDATGKQIVVSMKGKKKCSAKQLETMKEEFLNELLHCAIRHRVSKNSRKLREYIVGRALYSVLPSPDLFSSTEELDFQEDPLGIAVPWEEKYGEKK